MNNSKRKVLFICGGKNAAISFILPIVASLNNQFECLVACPNPRQDLTGLPVKSQFDVPIVRNVSPWADLCSLAHLILIIIKEKPECVISQVPKAGILAMLSSFCCLVPFRTHVFTGFVWETRTGMRRYILRLFDYLIILLSTECLVDGTHQLRYFQNRKYSHHKIKLIANGSICGVDTARFCPSPLDRKAMRDSLGVGQDGTVILSIGRISSDKGHPYLFKAFERLATFNDRLYLWIVGTNENCQKELEDIHSKFPDRLSIFEHSPTPEKFMKGADLFCSPSLREGFGLAALEAASCRLPLVVSNIPGFLDVAINEVNALKVEPKNVDALLLAINSLAKDNYLGLALGQKGRELAIGRFDRRDVSEWWRSYLANLFELTSHD